MFLISPKKKYMFEVEKKMNKTSVADFIDLLLLDSFMLMQGVDIAMVSLLVFTHLKTANVIVD